jgi:hypothetical protein
MRTVSLKVPEQDRPRIDAMLEQLSVNMRKRSAAWKQSGWTGFDPASQPYGNAEGERALPSTMTLQACPHRISARPPADRSGVRRG